MTEREPGYYWVRVEDGPPAELAEWTNDIGPWLWLLLSTDSFYPEEDVTVLSPRLEPPQ